MEKRCTLCEGVKPIEQFNKRARNVDGRSNVCRDCAKAQGRSYYHRTKQPREATCPNCGRTRSVYQTKSDYCRLCAYKAASPAGPASKFWVGTAHISRKLFHSWEKNAKHAFALTIEDVEALYIHQQGRCALTGRTLTFAERSEDKISLDRIDSSQGYYVGNVQLTTTAANIAKRRLTVPEFVRLAADVIKANSVPIEWLERKTDNDI